MYLLFFLGLCAFLISLAVTPRIRDFFLRRNIVDSPDHFRKLHAKAIPRLGGIAIACAYAGAFLIAMLLPIPNSGMLSAALPGVWKLCLAAGLVFLTGVLDDLVGLDPRWKLGEQLIAAGMAYLAGVQIHVLGGHWLDAWLSLPITLLWIVGCTNAFNLIDGLDGLAAGVGLFATLTVLVAAVTYHNVSLAILTVPLVGALLGFLRYNFNPASVFLGDSGSLLIGFLLGCYGVLWSHKSATILGMTAPLMAMSIPLLDAGIAIVRRFIRSQPIFGADRGHIHHKLLDLGLSPRRAALCMYGVSGLAAMFSLVHSTVVNQYQAGGVVILLFCLSAWLGIQHLGYVEFGMARQMFVKGAFRRMIDFQTRLQMFESSLCKAQTTEELWKELVGGARSFGFSSVQMRLDNKEYETDLGHRFGADWTFRIPLAHGQYIEFAHPLGATSTPLVASEFVRVIHAAVATGALGLAVPEVSEKPVAVGRALAMTSNA